MKKYSIKNEIIELKNLDPNFLDQDYVSWLNEPTVNQYLESRFIRWTDLSLKEYVIKANSDDSTLLFGIFLLSADKLIGTIKLSLINQYHKTAEIGLLIGDKTQWGKGIATAAIKLITKFSFQQLRLHKITAGAYANNKGSIKAFQKNGFLIEGIIKEQYHLNGITVDKIILGLINKQDI